MTLGLELVSAIVSAVASVFAAGILAFATWYIRKYVIVEVEKNSSMRRYIVGEEGFDDDGELDKVRGRIDESEQERKREHREVSQQLEFVSEYVKRIASAVNRELGTEVRNPETGGTEMTRGGDD